MSQGFENPVGRVGPAPGEHPAIASFGILAASIAHEVSQPLSGVMTNASACLRMLACDPPDLDGARESVRRTLRDGGRAAEVIVGLRALFARSEIYCEPVDLNEAARAVIECQQGCLQANVVNLRVDLAAGLPRVAGDRAQLQQVILNLVRNASDAMSRVEDRQRTLLIRTKLDERGSVVVSVRDTGTGFAPGCADKLFEPFYTTKSDGMGIGLFVSRSIILRHRGRLWATLNDGPGALFAFSIPSRFEGATPNARVHEHNQPPSP